MALYKDMIYREEGSLGVCSGVAEGTIYYGTISHHCPCLEKTMTRFDGHDKPEYKTNGKFDFKVCELTLWKFYNLKMNQSWNAES